MPPYSPDLNPIERIWLVMKARSRLPKSHGGQGFNNCICRTVDHLIDRLEQAILDVIANPQQVQETAAIGTLF